MCVFVFSGALTQLFCRYVLHAVHVLVRLKYKITLKKEICLLYIVHALTTASRATKLCSVSLGIFETIIYIIRQSIDDSTCPSVNVLRSDLRWINLKTRQVLIG